MTSSLAIVPVVLAVWLGIGGTSAGPARSVTVGADGRLAYAADAQGNRVMDFSHCGYGGGGVKLPDVPVAVTLKPEASGDDTARVQAAVEEVAKRPLGADGYRGAVMLSAGTYRISGTVKIEASGIVVRGAGEREGGTMVIATGSQARNVFEFAGKAPKENAGTRVKVTDEYVPVGATSFGVADASKFKVGDKVFVRRAGNAEWIHFIKMDQITPRKVPEGQESGTKQWEPFELSFDRVITAVDGNKVTVDAPIACAIEAKWGGGSIATYDDSGRISRVGIESLASDSEFDKSVKAKEKNVEYYSDEKHALYIAGFANAENGFARNLASTHYYHGVAECNAGAKWITIQDCKATEPVSVITGGRRYTYAIQGGGLILVQRCYSSEDRHAFVVGARVAGPNAFVDCVSEHAHATSEPHHRWSVGGLYDNVRADMAFQDRQWMGSGHGWAGANYVAWNCEGSLVCQSPPTAQNWSIGFVGKKEPGAFAGRPEGIWESEGKHVEPRSLYRKQLEDRLGAEAVRNVEK